MEPFEADEVCRVLAVALTKRNGVRFAIAPALGLRRGEAFGLKWSGCRSPARRWNNSSAERRTWPEGYGARAR